MIKYYICFFSCIITLAVKGQDAKSDMRKINEAYWKHSDLSMDITYNVYANWTDAAPLEVNTGRYIQHGNNRYNKLNEIESVQNNDCSLVIDNEEKIIVVGNPLKFDPAKITMLNMDTAFSKYKAVNPIKTSNTQKAYKLAFKPASASEYETVDIYFNVKTYLIEKLVFYYRNKAQLQKTNQDEAKEKPRLEIIFSKIKLEQAPEFKLYTETRFVTKKNNDYLSVGNYSAYKVINQKNAQ